MPVNSASSGSSPHTRGAPCQRCLYYQPIWIIPAYAGSTRYRPGTPDPRGDHPRIRGEHSRFSSPSAATTGSSPHTRGALGPVVAEVSERGIIPAYAGSTGWPAHHIKPRPGSSPHTRGAPLRLQQDQVLSRIIPAYAGSTDGRHAEIPVRADHPRIRGEHVWVVGGAADRGGSSPHTRGALSVLTVMWTGRGIIPAYAGSTGQEQELRQGPGDHPRIRGEHSLSESAVIASAGSSPHTRGAQIPGRVARRRRRIIPAYAGSTGAVKTPRAPKQDHPRIRGEHDEVPDQNTLGVGSSPHTRGAPGPETRPVPSGGIIPAYAGSTLFSLDAIHQTRDHPRIRGEHAPRCSSIRFEVGSSPHTRGARSIGQPGAFDRRIIPAYAGSTLFEDEFVENERDHPRIRGEHF